MTGTEIQALNTSVRGGREMDSVTFFSLANLAKAVWEGKRPWRQLLNRASSNSSTASHTYTTQYTLPTSFIMCTRRNALTLEDTGGAKMFYTEVPLEDFDNRRDEAGLFAIDLANSCYYLSGVIPAGNWTHKMNYTKRSPTLSADSTWVFPADYHPYIAFEVAVMDQLGIDYDDTNARQGAPNASRADMLLQAAIRWDDGLVRMALSGAQN